MKGALDAVAHDAPAGSEVGTEVRAVSVHHMGLAVLGAERSELLSCRKGGVIGVSLKPAAPGRARWAQGSGTRDPALSAQPPEGTGRPQQLPPTPHGSHPQHPFSGLSEPGSAEGEKPPPQKCVKTWDAPSAKEGLQVEQSSGCM